MAKIQGHAMGTALADVQSQLGLIDRAAMLALPVRLDLIEAAGQAFDVAEWNRELELVTAP